ncbi:MAG: multiprotein bridging factor aMBF1 [Thermoprotei archaeon]
MPCYCEICGREVKYSYLCRTVVLDNATVKVCPDCYRRLIKEGRIKTATQTVQKPSSTKTRQNIPTRILESSYEIVEDYATKIKRAREKKGWSQAVLAQKVQVSENVIKRIEAGRLKPGIQLARKLEKILGITLLEPVVEEYKSFTNKEEDYLTIGDIIKLKDEK